jgi:hypothetical protein
MVQYSVADPDPGWVKNPDMGKTTRIVLPRAKKQFFGLKYLNSLMRIRIRNKRLGSDPQH